MADNYLEGKRIHTIFCCKLKMGSYMLESQARNYDYYLLEFQPIKCLLSLLKSPRITQCTCLYSKIKEAGHTHEHVVKRCKVKREFGITIFKYFGNKTPLPSLLLLFHY
jgi:hypothetical protein